MCAPSTRRDALSSPEKSFGPRTFPVARQAGERREKRSQRHPIALFPIRGAQCARLYHVLSITKILNFRIISQMWPGAPAAPQTAAAGAYNGFLAAPREIRPPPLPLLQGSAPTSYFRPATR